MQQRMKDHQMSSDRIEDVLKTARTAVLATVNPDGTPYAVPVHFVYDGRSIYFHGLPAGKKLDNVKLNPAVSLCVYDMTGLIFDGSGIPCEVNTEYVSVVVTGKAEAVADFEEKKDVFDKIVSKYTPDLSSGKIPQGVLKSTAVTRIVPDEITGKYYP